MSSEESEPLISKIDNTRIPKDRLYAVYAVFYLLGIGTLLPWNFFSNAKQYFSYKLRNVTSTNASNFEDPENETHLQGMFESYLTIAAMVPNILFMFLNTAATKLISLRFRIIVAAVTMIIMFLGAIIFTRINTDSWQQLFFTITIVSIVIMNAGSAVLQGGIFGLSGLFPKEYTQSVMGGMGMGGTIAAVANILVLAIGSDPNESGFGYFIIAEVFLVLALLGFLALPHMRYARYHTFPNDESMERDRTISVNSSSSPNTDTDLLSSSSAEYSHSYSEYEVPRGDMPKVISPESVGSSLYSVFKKIWVYALSVFLTFFVTLSCYPAVNSSIKSSSEGNGPWASRYFTAVTCFLAFNVCDWIGRSIAGPVQWPKEDSPLIPLFSVLRVLFIPLFLMCNIEPRGHLIPTFFVQDWIPGVLMAVFAISNGYLGTLCMMYGPRLVGQADIETAGSMMSFFLSSGLGLGSLVSLLLMLVIKQV